jgi:hypothetical protein
MIKNCLSLCGCSKNFNSSIEKREREIKHIERNTTPLIELLQSFDMEGFVPILSNEYNATFDPNAVYTDVSEQDIYKINFIYTSEGKIRKVPKGHRNPMLFSWGINCNNSIIDEAFNDCCRSYPLSPFGIVIQKYALPYLDVLGSTMIN